MKRILLLLVVVSPHICLALDLDYNIDEDLIASNTLWVSSNNKVFADKKPQKVLEYNEDRWTWYDYMVEGVLLGLIYIDYRQTRYFLEQGTSYEKNKILGKYPSRSRLKNYIVLASLTHIGISVQIGKKYGKQARRFWLNGSLLKEYYTIDRNSEIGHTMNRVF